MSGLDYEVFNTLERALSGDLNDLEALKDRAILDSFKELFEDRAAPAVGTWTGIPVDRVLGGLEVIPAGADLSVNPGVLMQNSAVMPPAPGALDSTYRYAASRTAQLVLGPAPGVETWYLVEAQMAEATTLSTPRDVYNPGLGIFVPALVPKQRERRVALQITAGVPPNAPAPTFGWVPLALVRRPAGGGPVAASDIVDVRPLPSLFKSETVPATLIETGFRTEHVPGAAANNRMKLRAEGIVRGMRLHLLQDLAGGAGFLDLTTPRYLDPTTALLASSWFYVYLCPWSTTPLAPGSSAAYNGGDTIISRGVLVLSAVAPLLQGSQTNGAALNLPSPYGVSTASAGRALLIGALRRNVVNTGWDWQASATHRRYRIESLDVLAYAAPPIGPETVAMAGIIPANARSAILSVGWASAGAVSLTGLIECRPVGAAVGSVYEATRIMANVAGGASTGGDVTMEVPLTFSTSFDLEFRVGLGVGQPALRNLRLIGYTT